MNDLVTMDIRASHHHNPAPLLPTLHQMSLRFKLKNSDLFTMKAGDNILTPTPKRAIWHYRIGGSINKNYALTTSYV